MPCELKAKSTGHLLAGWVAFSRGYYYNVIVVTGYVYCDEGLGRKYSLKRSGLVSLAQLVHRDTLGHHQSGTDAATRYVVFQLHDNRSAFSVLDEAICAAFA